MLSWAFETDPKAHTNIIFKFIIIIVITIIIILFLFIIDNKMLESDWFLTAHIYSLILLL